MDDKEMCVCGHTASEHGGDPDHLGGCRRCLCPEFKSIRFKSKLDRKTHMLKE